MTSSQSLWEGIFTAIPPLPSLKVSEWADKYRVLSPERTNEHGKYSCDRIPMQREPMDSVNDPAVSETVLWWAAQTAGKTEVLCNICGFFMHADPSPILFVNPTTEFAEEFSEDAIAPMIRDTPPLSKVVRSPKSRNSGNKILSKRYIGGSLILVGANAPSGLAGRPRRVILKDEIDRYPFSAGKEGDPCALADKRAETYGKTAVKVSTSTGTVKGLSRIENKYEQSDQRKWFITHKKCGHEFVLMWDHLKWSDENGDGAWIECPCCKGQIDDAERVAMVRAGKWKATAPFTGIRGYWINGLNTLFEAHKGYKNRLHQFVGDYLKAKKGGTETYKVWINTFLSETYEEDTEQITPSEIEKRAEDYAKEELPNEILLLTAGADVHKNRIECEIVGWGVDEEAWGATYVVVEGDTEKDQVWHDFDKLLLTTFTREDGVELAIEKTFIDMGHKDRRVLGFCRPRLNRGVYPCRGLNRPGVNRPPLLPAKPSRNNKARIPHWNIGVTVAKEQIYDRLMLTPGEPRSMHFPRNAEYGTNYYKQLTAEKRKKKFQYGQPYFIFEKENNAVRNEALDVRVYALAAMASLAPIAWRTLEKNMKKRIPKDRPEPKVEYVAPTLPQSEPANAEKDRLTPTEPQKLVETPQEAPAPTPERTPVTPQPTPHPQQHHRTARRAHRPFGRGGFVGGWR